MKSDLQNRTDLKTIARKVRIIDKRKTGYLYSVLSKIIAAYNLGFQDGQKNKP